VEKIFALALKSRSSIGHYTLSLCSSDLATKVCLSGLAELALSAFWCTMQTIRQCVADCQWKDILKRDNVISRLDRGDPLANRFYDSSTLMAENDWECSLGVLSRQSIRICRGNQLSQSQSVRKWCKSRRTGMADTGVVDFNSDFVGFWRGNFDILDGEIFACLPSNCRLYEISVTVSRSRTIRFY
jgi:hypothetical protein